MNSGEGEFDNWESLLSSHAYVSLPNFRTSRLYRALCSEKLALISATPGSAKHYPVYGFPILLSTKIASQPAVVHLRNVYYNITRTHVYTMNIKYAYLWFCIFTSYFLNSLI